MIRTINESSGRRNTEVQRDDRMPVPEVISQMILQRMLLYILVILLNVCTFHNHDVTLQRVPLNKKFPTMIKEMMLTCFRNRDNTSLEQPSGSSFAYGA